MQVKLPKMSNNKIPMIRRVLSDSQYDWIMRNFPFRIMYSYRWIDTQHQMWLPRWGYSNKQIADAKKKAEEWIKGINWD